MTRALRLASAMTALLGLAACSPGYSDEGSAPKTEAEKAAEAEAVKKEQARVIQGEVLAPEGQTLDGAKVMACLTPREACAQEAEIPVVVKDGKGHFTLIVPAEGDYHLTVWKDVNGDGAPNGGDLLAFANNMEAVRSGQRLSPMTAFVRVGDGPMTTNPGGKPMGTYAELEASAATVKAAGLRGTWSQASTGSELVWGPEIKFQAASATVGFGTNLGGTFGAGSPTNTTIVYSYKPVQVRRTMKLTVEPDGAFHWIADQERKQGKCRSVRQEKHGRVKVEGDKLTFVVADARQTCGGKTETLELKDETYTLTKGGEGFRLTGDKGVNWAFSGG